MSDVRNPQQFGDIELSFKPSVSGSSRHDPHFVVAHKGGSIVGSMNWHPGYGEIQEIEVSPRYRRQGIASKMWEYGHKIANKEGVTPPAHSEIRTVAGDAWAHAVGGEIPPRYPESPDV